MPFPLAQIASTAVLQLLPDTQKNSAEPPPPQIADIKALLRQDLTLNQCKLLHTYVAFQGWEQDTHLSNHIITMYGRCWSLEDARSVFYNTQHRDVVTWNSMVSVYVRNGDEDEAFNLYRDMGDEDMWPDPITFLNALQTCTETEHLSRGELLHAHTLKYGVDTNSAVFAALIHAYCKCGGIRCACRLFPTLHTQETVPWNAMISGLFKQHCNREALDYFYEMLRNGIKADMITFLAAASACANLQSLEEGRDIHLMIQQFGFESEVYCGNALITMYGKCQALEESILVFDQMRCRDLASWNAMIGAYNQALDSAGAMSLFERMQEKKIRPDIITYTSLLSACETLGNMEKVYEIHMHLANDGLDLCSDVSSELLNAYSKCEAFDSVDLLFNRMPKHNILSWNIMVSMHAQQEHVKEVIDLVLHSTEHNIEPDDVTLVSALTSCRKSDALERGRCLHAHIYCFGLEGCSNTANALISMYSNCGSLTDSSLAFEKMANRNVVSWNSIMNAHAQCGKGTEVLDIFRKLQAEGYCADEGTYVSALCGCASLGSVSEGYFVHGHLVENGYKTVPIESALMIMYGKCGTLEDVEVSFCKMNHGSLVSWNTFLSVCSLQGQYEKALMLFRQMQNQSVRPDIVTLVSILNVCASVNALEDLRTIHKDIVLWGLERDLLVGTALMSAYGKCGTLDDARRVFDMVEKRDMIAWNALISMYGQQGLGKMAFAVFEEMLSKNVRPNNVTYVNVLSSCSHAGLLDEGKETFLSLVGAHDVKPTAKLYGCMVDLLGRAGQLGNAEKFIASESLQKDDLPWCNLLGACSFHGDLERAKRAADCIAGVDAEDSSTYVLLANMCTVHGL